MNKIFKVIWNNAKHCYVVACELAKSYSKGGRTISRASIALGAAVLIYAASGNVMADSGGNSNGLYYIGYSPYNVEVTKSDFCYIYGRKETTADSNNATVTMSGTSGDDGILCGGYSENGKAANNTVNITGGTMLDHIYGGYATCAENNRVNISGGTAKGFLYGGFSTNGNVSSNSVTINGGTVNELDIVGGYTIIGNAENNSVNIFDKTVKYVHGGFSQKGKVASNSVYITGNVQNDVYGGYSQDGGVENNSVTIAGNVLNEVYGGYSEGGDVENNSVNVTSGTIEGIINGGYTDNGRVNNNSVNISGGTINSNITGGCSDNAENVNLASNSVIISGGMINSGQVYGASTPNGTAVRNLVKIIGGNINADIIGAYSENGNIDRNSVIISGGTFDPYKTIYAGYIYETNNSKISNNTVNLTDTVTGLDSAEIYGYFYEDSDGDHSGNELHIGGTKTYDSEDNPVVSNGNIWQGKSSNGTVNNSINKVANFESIVLHSVSWNKDLASLIVNTLDSVDTLDITNIKFYKNDKEKTDFAVGDNMDLVKWITEVGDITNLKYKSEDTGNEQTSLLQNNPISIQPIDVTLTDKGIAIDGTGKCSILKNNRTVKFTVNQIILNSVDISNWNGQESTITSNWNGESNVSVVTGSFQHPTNVAPGSSITILTTADSAFKNDKITGSRFFGNNVDDTTFEPDFTDDTDKGITFTGKYEKGVKASDDNKSLIYAVGTTKFIKNIDLGTINTTNTRNMENADYDFSKVSTIDATNLKIDNHEDLNKGDAVNLLTNAKNLEAGKTVTGASHSQERTVTDNNSGIYFEGELIGNVSTIAETVQYTLTDKKLNKIDLSNWNGTTLNGNLNHWTSTENATIETDGMSAAVINGLNLNPGDNFDIISETSGNNFFAGMEIKGGLAWQSAGELQDTAVNGISVTGQTTGGGVKFNDDYNKVVYHQMDNAVDKIKIGQVTFVNGETARTFSNEYNMTGATIDATDLTFTNSTNLLKPNDSMTLVSNAAGITTQTTVTDGTDKTININYLDNTSGISYGAKAFGDVTADTNAVKYTINTVSGESINLNNWNGTTVTFPDKWVADANGVTVTGLFTDPGLSAGESQNILTASNAIFKDEKIDDSIRFNETGSFKDDSENGVTISGTQTGGVKATDEGKALTYYAIEKTIENFNLADWDGENNVEISSTWKIADGASVETDSMSNLPESDSEKEIFILRSDKEGYFANVAINGENLYGKKLNKFTESDEAESVIISGVQEKGITFDSDKKNLVYKFGSKDVTSSKLNTIAWKDGAVLLSRDQYNYSKLTSLDTKDFNVVFEKPEAITANQSMTLLKANDTLADMATIDNSVSYQHEPVSGVIMDAIIKSSLETKNGNVTLTTVSNNANKLTFGNIDWLDNGALIDHKTLLNNVSFDGAEIDTSKIAFGNKEMLNADMQMTLVSDFNGNPGTITGSKYKVGTAYEGEGSAYMDGNNLVFKTKTAAGLTAATHKPAMAMVAGIANLTSGNEQISEATEGIGDISNSESDEVSSFFSVKGRSARYETGSYVDTNSWNCILAVGKNSKNNFGTLEYGLFGEYGRGNYTLHMDGIGDAGSGNSHYTGGGLLMKWTNKHNTYTEASFRLGNMNDKTFNILHDGAGNAYGYDVNTKYRGCHFGIGKKYVEENGSKLEIYSKFFYNQREGISFNAGPDHYCLEDIRSRVLRAGFKYGTTNKKWNSYGGLAYDYEFGGESKGTVNGTPIRSATIKGGTLRGEFGYCREATKTNPWKTDISIFGFTGKHKGVGGSIAVEYHF